MARLFTTGFELGEAVEHDGSAEYGSGGYGHGLTASATYKRTGNYGLQCDIENNGGDQWFAQTLDDKAELYFQVAFMYRNSLPLAPTSIPMCLIAFFEAGTCQISIGFRNDTCRLYAYRGGTGDMGQTGGAVLDTSTDGLRENQWYLMEGHIVLDGAAGELTVKINNTTVLSFGPGDTIATSNAWADVVRVGCNNCGVGVGNEVYLDDVAINDTTGSYQNSWVGGAGVFLLKPTADGAHSDFTPSTGVDNYAMVDEVPANDSDWNYSSTAGHQDTFTLEDLDSVITAVDFIEAIMQAGLAQSGIQTIQGLIRHGGVDYDGDTHNISSVAPDWQVEKDDPVYEELGDSGLWTPAEVNALEAGYEIPT